MKNIAFLIITLAWIHLSNSFRLQGTWILKEIRGFPVYQFTTMQIQDYISRESEIMQKIIFSGCQTYKYMLEVNQSNIFVKYSTYQVEQVKQQTNSMLKCSQNATIMHKSIRDRLGQVFNFQIFGNILVFLNPVRQILFKFQRQESVKIRILRGIWNLDSMKSQQISQNIQIADTEISLCQGKLVVGYLLSDKYSIKTRLISNNGCSQKSLESAVLSSAFYRRIGRSVQIYNSGLQLVLELSYLSDINLQSVQKQRLEAIQQAKRIQQKNKQAQVQSKPQTTLSIKLVNTEEDLIGKWQFLSVSGMPLASISLNLIFTQSKISFNGSCNSFQFQYTTSNGVNQLKIGKVKSSSNNKCPIDDDGLYITAILKMNKYSITAQGSNTVQMIVTDVKGNVVYQLRRTVEATNSSSLDNKINNTSNEQVVGPPSNSLNLYLQQGRYVFFILARRDLPRKFCKISPTKITYEGCNSVEHTYYTSANSKVRIQGGVTTTKTCTSDYDQIISNTFNSVVQFTKGAEIGSYTLRNANNVDSINLSLF